MWPFDQNRQDMYQNYAQAYNTGDYSGIDPQEAQGQLQQFVQNAPPDVQQQVYQQHFSQLAPNQLAELAQQFPPEYGVDPNNPSSLAQGLARASQERPDLAQRVLAHPILLAGSVGLAALVARHMLERNQR